MVTPKIKREKFLSPFLLVSLIGSVLGKPSKTERHMIEQAIGRGIEVFPMILDGDYQKAMTQLHTDEEP